jgi:hypothetical protein
MVSLLLAVLVNLVVSNSLSLLSLSAISPSSLLDSSLLELLFYSRYLAIYWTSSLGCLIVR